MCYDISYKTDLTYLEEYFPQVVIDNWIDIDFSITVHRMAHSYLKNPVVIKEDGVYKLKLFEWGLIAAYMNSEEKIKKQRAFMCNARAEKFLIKSYWNSIRSQRCLIPVVGIYEHRTVKSKKVPYFITLKNRKMFCLPGLYNYSNIPDENGEINGTFTIVTRKANVVMGKIHNNGENKERMPLFLTKELEMEWLENDLTDERLNEILSFEYPSHKIDFWPVHTIRSASSRPDGKLKNEPWEWANLPDLGLGEASQGSLF